MKKFTILFILIILSFFSLCPDAVFVAAQSNGIDVNLGVEGCNNNGICESPAGETALTCPVDCAAATPTPSPSGDSSHIIPGSNTNITISDISIQPNFTSAVIYWLSSRSTISTIRWGETTDANEGILRTVAFSRDHNMEIINLKPGTLYYFTIESEDVNGNTNISQPIYFFTKFLVDTTFPLIPRNVMAAADISGITISWQNPPDDNFSYVRVMRHSDRFSGDPFSGQLIYEGGGMKFLDTDVKAGQKYFYVLFSRNNNGNFSGGVGVSAIAYSGKTMPPPEPPPPVVFISETFFAHQYGQQVEPLTNLKTITVDGNISTVVDTKSKTLPDDWMEVVNPGGVIVGKYLFSFNSDSGRYQSVIPPLEKPGTYFIKILRYEKNVPTIISEGTLTIKENIALPVAKSYQDNYKNYFIFPIMLFILLLLILIPLLKLRKNLRTPNPR